MKITDRVHIVGSGQNGFNLSNAIDCHVYLLNGGDEYALIDAGGGVESHLIVENIEADGLDPAKVRHLLLTHAHADHSAGAAWLHEHLDLVVAGSNQTAEWVSAGDEDAISLGPAKRGGMYPEDYLFRPCPVDVTLAEGDTYRLGDLDLSVIETPGHSAGKLSFVFREHGQVAAFTGDAIFPGGKILLQDIWDCSVTESCRSIEKLHKLQIDSLFPGHLSFSVQRGHIHLEAAMARIAQLLPPESYV